MISPEVAIWISCVGLPKFWTRSALISAPSAVMNAHHSGGMV